MRKNKPGQHRRPCRRPKLKIEQTAFVCTLLLAAVLLLLALCPPPVNQTEPEVLTKLHYIDREAGLLSQQEPYPIEATESGELIGSLVTYSPTHTESPEVVETVEPEPYWGEYPFDDKTLEDIVVRIAIEAEGASIEEKRMVAQVILDRTIHQLCSDGTVSSTLHWEGQWSWRDNYVVQDEDYEVVDWVFRDGNRVTEEPLIYFCSPRGVPEKTMRWFDTLPLIRTTEYSNFYSDWRVYE